LKNGYNPYEKFIIDFSYIDVLTLVVYLIVVIKYLH